MGRFFDFVDEHGPGFAALMRGGPAVGSSTANAMIDGVRQAACEQILAHLGVEEPRPGWSWSYGPGCRSPSRRP